MKYLTYLLMAIASACLIILLSLSSCSISPQRAVSKVPTPTIVSPLPSLGSTQPIKATVKIHNFKFEPASLEISIGETVQFINTDEEPHTATSTDGAFDSKALDTEQTWNYTATKPGSFPYICSIHPFMKGTLTVTPKKN